MSLKESVQLPFWNITITILIVLTLPFLLQDGMFTDGVLYTAVSKNLANGMGSFWYPWFSKTMFAPFFHQQPPLTFSIQALFFKLFGNSIYVERFYSFFTLCISAFLLHRLWKNMDVEDDKIRQLSWLPLLLWIIIPVCYWAYANNVEENTMGIFTLLSTYCMYTGLSKQRPVLYLVTGSLLALIASLCKGFPGLFPLIIPLIYWFTFRSFSFKKAMLFSLITIGTLFLGYTLLLLNADARISLSAYLSDRVINSIKNVSTENDRFYLIKQLEAELFIPSILVILLIFFLRLRSISVEKKSAVKKHLLFFLLIGLSGSLPLIVTLEQRRFYLVTSLPFYAIALGLFMAPGLSQWINGFRTDTKKFKLLQYACILLPVAGICYSFSFVGKRSRDYDKLHDVYLLGKIITPGKVIRVYPETWNDWGLHNYFVRHFNISLAKDTNAYDYLMIDKEMHEHAAPGYTKLPIATLRYELYKIKKAD